MKNSKIQKKYYSTPLHKEYVNNLNDKLFSNFKCNSKNRQTVYDYSCHDLDFTSQAAEPLRLRGLSLTWFLPIEAQPHLILNLTSQNNTQFPSLLKSLTVKVRRMRRRKRYEPHLDSRHSAAPALNVSFSFLNHKGTILSKRNSNIIMFFSFLDGKNIAHNKFSWKSSFVLILPM